MIETKIQDQLKTPIPVSSSGKRKWLDLLNALGPVLALVGIYTLFCIIGPSSFSSVRNLETIARQTAIVGTAALGMTMIIILGGIDLSVGSVVALSTVSIAWLLQYHSASPLLAAAGGIAIGSVAGLAIGVLVTRLKVVPFIVTLGMMLLVRGAAKGLAGEQKIDAPMTWLNELLAALAPGQKWMLVPAGVWILLVLAVTVSVMLRYTRFGRHIYAVGSNESTARLCGIATDRVKVLVYTISGTFAGLAGLQQFSRLTVGDPPSQTAWNSTSSPQSSLVAAHFPAAKARSWAR
jgi:ribose/xylose/arabinose/galactoside ABC-type transport system permease subunit